MRLTFRHLVFVVVNVIIYCSLRAIFVIERRSIESNKLTKDRSTLKTDDVTLSTVRSNSNRTTAATGHEGDGGRVVIPACHVDYLGLSYYADSKLCSNETPQVCNSLSCRSLLSGTGKELRYGNARRLMSSRPPSFLPDSYFANVTRDCDAFKRNRGYHLIPLSSEEADFPLAFNLIVHTSAEQVEGQLRALYRPQNSFCIHVDAKANAEFMTAMEGIANCFDNVFIASKLERLTWGGYSRLQADINCMRDHLYNTSSFSSSSSSRGKPQKQWRYLINTAGLAFPLKTIGEMVKALKIYNGANDVEGIYGARVIRSRFEKEWSEDADRRTVQATGRRNPKPPHELFVVRGSAYALFSRRFVRFILEDRKAIDLLRWARKTWSPDELFWATLHHTYSNPHLHTPGGYSGYPSDKPWLAVYANWDDGEMKCHGKRVRGVCVFGVGDLPNLTKRREFFANKFYKDFEPLALQCLSSWIRQKETCPPHFDDKYYHSLPFIRRRTSP